MKHGLRVVALGSCLVAAACRGKDESAAPAISPEDAAKMIALENRGIGALERYDYTDAVAPLREAVAIAPKWVSGRYNLALALVHAGRDKPAEASALLDGVLKDAPNHPHANFMAAWLAENSGADTQDRALKLYEKAYRLTGKDAVVGAKYGGMLARIDDKEKEAVAILEECHARRPSLISPVYQLMQLWRRLGDETKAEQYHKMFDALNGHARAGVDRSTVGQGLQDAYGGLGPYSMAIRDFDVPATMPAAELAAVAVDPPKDLCAWKAGALPENAPFLGCAVFDFDQDGDLDLFVCGGDGPCALLRNDGGGKFTDVAAQAGVAIKGVYAVCAGEFDVEPTPTPNPRPCRRAKIDLVLMTNSSLVYLANKGDGTFVDRTKESGLSADAGSGRALLAFDADQEGDLDLFVSAGYGAKNRLWANRGPGEFVDVAESAGLAGDFKAYGPAAAVDFDGDYDLDLVVTRPDGPPVVFANDRAMKFHEVALPAPLPKAPYGVAALGDRLVLAGDAGATWLRWSTGDSIDARPVDGAPGGPVVSTDLRGAGVRDLVFADGTWLPGAKDVGASPFTAGKRLFDAKPSTNVVAFDADGDGVEEIVLVRPNEAPQIVRVAGKPAGASLVCDFEGVIKNDVQAGWSNIEGRGALVEVKAGASLQKFRIGNPSGFGCAAPTRLVAGLGSAKQADFVRIVWPDAVQQAVLDVPSGQVNCIVEEQRRPDSCPLLFSWDGAKYAFVTDFLGVGGIGFLVAPGTYGKPDPTESVKVDAALVKPRADGKLSFRIVEAMEEVCFLDKADLQVIDHPADVTVFPDERFAGDEPFPNGDLLAYRREIPPVAARDAKGADVTALIASVDRRWPDAAKLHPRLAGATSEQILELDFGDRLADVAPGDGIVLYVNGWIEYGYTRTTVAAAGEGFAFVGPLLEAWSDTEKTWKTLVPNLGYPAGFPRVMTYDVTGKVSRETPRLRIRTNYEVYFDKVWLARKADVAKETRVAVLDPSAADLRWVGYPRDVKPDGRDPPVYDYQTLDPSAPWKTMEGDYTRFGDVRPLLTKSDDMFVVFGKGEEIELVFDPSTLPALPAGWTRDYVLRFDGWCKGQELYTAHGWTVEPLPFHAMSNYPYRADERYPDDEAHRKYRAEWNTRRVGSSH
jgi:Tfp pilus assembly protein PilF